MNQFKLQLIILNEILENQLINVEINIIKDKLSTMYV